MNPSLTVYSMTATVTHAVAAAVRCSVIRCRALHTVSDSAALDGSKLRLFAGRIKNKATSRRHDAASPGRKNQRGWVIAVKAAADEDAVADEVKGDDGIVSVSDLVEMEVGGVSVSERGFVALLVPKGCKDNLRNRAKNIVESLRGGVVNPSSDPPEDHAARLTLPVLVTQGTDTDGAVSEWAQTLLQLLQTPPIDMGILLPYSALDHLTKTEGSVLGAALIGKATFATGTLGGEAGRVRRDDAEEATHHAELCEYEFAATLLAGKEFEQNSIDVVGGVSEAWRTLALALRYSPYGARIFATEEALRSVDARHYRGSVREKEGQDVGRQQSPSGGDGDGGGGLTMGSVREVFPRLQTVSEARAIAAKARNLLLDPFKPSSGDVSSDDVDTMGGSGEGGVGDGSV